MKTIIRKPKFMRNDDVMKSYIDIAAIVTKDAARPEMTLEQQIYLLKKAGECLKKAAKAGGFQNVGDMHRWLCSETNT